MTTMNNMLGEFTIRDVKRNKRFCVDNEFFENGYAAMMGRYALVYFLLAKYAHMKTQTCFPSYDTITKYTGIKNRNTIAKIIETLEALNIIAINNPKIRKANTYTLIDYTKWRPAFSITSDTVAIVSKTPNKQYRKYMSRSIKHDTGNQRRKSAK